MSQDLINQLDRLGIVITADDVPTILRLGIDRFLSNVRFITDQESLSQVHIILNEMRQHKT